MNKKIIFFLFILILPISFGVISDTFTNSNVELNTTRDCYVRTSGSDSLALNQISKTTYLDEVNLYNNWYCYHHNHYSYEVFKYNMLENNFLKSEYGAYSDTENQYLFLTKILDSNIDIYDSTTFSYYGSSTDIDKIWLLCFLDTDGKDKLCLQLSGSSTGYMANVTTLCAYNSSIYSFTESNATKSFTYQDVKEFCAFANAIPVISDISMIALKTQWGFGATPEYLFFDTFEMEYYDINDNELPVFNSLDVNPRSQCYNPNGKVTFDLDINATDLDGDTIYYAIGTGNYNYSEYIDYGNENCWLNSEILDIHICNYYPDYTFENNYVTDSGSCNISDYVVPVIDDKLLRLKSIEKQSTDYYTRVDDERNTYGFELNNDCIGNTDYLYELKNPVANLDYKTEIYGLNSGENFTIEFLNSDYTKLLSLWVRGISDNITYYNMLANGTFVYIGEGECDYSVVGIRIIQDINNDEYSIMTTCNDVSIDTFTGISQANSELDYINNIYYINLNYSQSYEIVQMMFEFTSQYSIPDWTSTKPTEFNTSVIGDIPVVVFISDSVHYPSEYNYYLTNVYVDNSLYCDSESIEDLEIDFLGFVKDDTLGFRMRETLESMGYYEDGKIIIWWMFIISIILMSITSFIGGRSLNLKTTVLICSLGYGFLSYMVEYRTHFIVFLILIALTLAEDIAKIFTGGSYG